MSEISYGEARIRMQQRRKADREVTLARLREGIAGLRYVELSYVAYDDHLRDEQIDAYLAHDWETIHESIEEWESDQRWDNTRAIIDELLQGIDSEFFANFDDLDPDDADEMRYAVEDKDTSDPIRDLVRNTPNQLFRATIARPGRNWYIFHDGEYAKAQAWVAGQLYGAGVPLLPAARIADNVLRECGDWIHDGHTLDVIWYGDIETLAKAEAGDRLEFTDPHIVLLDRMNGSGYDTRLDFDITVTLDEERMPHLDRTGWGYGWDAVAGVYAPAYATDVRVIKEEI